MTARNRRTNVLMRSRGYRWCSREESEGPEGDAAVAS